jgi:hypothetical protein
MTTGHEVPVGRTYVKKVRALIAAAPTPNMASEAPGNAQLTA